MKTTNTNPFKVGDIVYTSWGYSMTLVDFYQVIRTTASKVELRSIQQKTVAYDGYLSGRVVPIADEFFQDGGPYSVQPGQLCAVKEKYIIIPSYPGARDKNRARLWNGQPVYFNHCD